MVADLLQAHTVSLFNSFRFVMFSIFNFLLNSSRIAALYDDAHRALAGHRFWWRTSFSTWPVALWEMQRRNTDNILWNCVTNEINFKKIVWSLNFFFKLLINLTWFCTAKHYPVFKVSAFDDSCGVWTNVWLSHVRGCQRSCMCMQTTNRQWNTNRARLHLRKVDGVRWR